MILIGYRVYIFLNYAGKTINKPCIKFAKLIVIKIFNYVHF